MAETVVVETECVWVPLGSEDPCLREAVYECHDPAEEDDFWSPACIDCAALNRAEGIHVRTLRPWTPHG